MALSAPRSTVQSGPNPISSILEFPVKATTKIWQGALVCLEAGYAIAGVVGSALVAVGIAQETADNSSGGTGAINVKVRAGVFLLDNYDAIAQADVGAFAYVFDDYRVAKSSDGGGRSVAGRILAVNPAGYPAGVLVSVGVQNAVFTADQYAKFVLTIPIAALSEVADADVLARYKPGFAFRIAKHAVQVTKAVSTGAKATTLTPKIGATPLTGGIVTLAGAYAKGAVQDSAAAVSAGNVGTSTDEITIVASATTTFIEGAACIQLTFG